MKLFNFLFDPLRPFRAIVLGITDAEKEVTHLSDAELREVSMQLREKASSLQGETALDELLPKAFAVIREAAKRTLGQRHFDVQLIGGIALHKGNIAEMATGEGKTLAATAPIYLNALAGKGVHVVTVNEYLAKRDTVWMGQIYHFLGLRVACLAHEGAIVYDPTYIKRDAEKLIDTERDTTGSFLVQEEYLRPISRKEAYEADITYGTNHEFGFDYLRDNLVYGLEAHVQKRGHHFAVIDEVDSILIDEARTPLIISAPDVESSDAYKTCSHIAANLIVGEDYTIDEKFRLVEMTDAGIDKVEKMLKIKNIYDPENSRWTHYLEESLKAHGLFKRDKDYVVKNDEVIIVDQNTGRLMHGRRYSSGLHQALEAKEGVHVQQESRTYAQITIQNYFKLYKKLAGMTGTAQTSAEEFHKVYGLGVVTIPTNKKNQRKDMPDLIYKTAEAKYRAVAEDAKKMQEKGQPVLIGTISIEKNELMSRMLNQAGVQHEILNAKNNEREGAIIAQAGRRGAVTIATNMAGRGVDIVLGGNPPDIVESEKVKATGGLHVIGTERHDARRIDNQLRGRAGRQGDPGSSQFYLSLEDDLMRIFGGDRIKKMMETLKVPEDMPIESRMVSSSVSQAQSRVEGFNFDARKHLLDYDNILNKQRLAIYEKRQLLLAERAPAQMLSMLDMLWMTHLENMEALRESVRLRAYAQHDPLIEYRKEGHQMFQQILADYEKWVKENSEKLKATSDMNGKMVNVTSKMENKSFPVSHSTFNSDKVGRNDPCPCGAKDAEGHPIKYKRCHGR
ncbi:MAG: preprotein translocase subunit SecA [bacterium]|nr:preprotein translocase subunit SecA [bacterium]